MTPKQPEPTFKEIIQSIHRIVQGPERPKSEKPRRGLSPGLLLMAVVALVITIAATVKTLQQN
ncbi:hypothetical protein [Dongia sp. agr-C8]